MKTLKMLMIGAMLSISPLASAQQAAVLEQYADIAHAVYEDSLSSARALKSAVDRLIASPSDQSLQDARTAWRAARVPYQQSEAYRFGNPVVDEWEGKVNSWPLDEGMIDYVAASYGAESEENPHYRANIIANPTLRLAGKVIDARRITKQLLAETLHELGGVEANVATGYHAIEFLLWGQDLNGTGPGAGSRPASDFDPSNCSWGNCDRRAAYLEAATELLIDDLAWMTGQWAPGGPARAKLLGGDPTAGLVAMITGMGSLSYGELAGERMRLGLMLHDPEEEHDCFSDNTHNSHYYDAAGIRNVYLGRYVRIDGTLVQGASLSDLVRRNSPEADTEMRARLDATMAAMDRLKRTADSGVMAYDQMIGEGNEQGNAIVQAAIDALLAQTKAIEKVVGALGLKAIAFEGSDSLDKPQAVFK